MNSFDLLRLMAAIAVIFHHGRPFAGQDPIRIFSFDFGALGVGVFFVISGYLVTASHQRSQGAWDYLKKRLLRIEPGLIVSVAVTALVLGAAVTTLPLSEYLSRPDVWLYVVRNALLYPVTYELPGVFETNPISAVNPSLWTLRFEFTCYLALAALGAVGLLSKGPVALLATAAALVTLWLGVLRPDLATEGPWRVALIGAQFSFLFAAGAYVQLLGRPLPLWTLASVGLLATPMWVLGLPALVIVLGELRSARLPADVSYGLYIYACPVQQILVMSGALSFWAALGLTLPLAVASWFLVERPALKLKRASARAPRP
jgi:peptidoglycan/LPS O-acetylase OafA/YrhL